MRVVDPARVLVLMAVAGVSRRRLASVAGLRSHTYLLRVLNGTVATVRPDVAVAMAAALGVGVDELFAATVTSDAGRGDKGAAA